MLGRKNNVPKDDKNPEQPIEFPNASGGSSKKSRKVWWISGTTVVVILVAGFAGYKIYMNDQFTHYKQAGDLALQLKNYTVAEQDYTSALKFKPDLVTQSQLQLAQLLLASTTKFKEGQQQLQSGNYQQAYNTLKQVSPQDKADYSSAQKLMSEAQTELLVGHVISDLQAWTSDENTFTTDVNAAVNPSNALANDTLGTQQFSDDFSSLQSVYSNFTNDLSTLQQDASKINTDAQLIPSSQVQVIITNLESALSKYETDANNMSASLNSEVTSAQQNEQAYNNGQYAPYNLSTGTTQWNNAITDTETQDTTISNDFAKLKAYQSNLPTSNNSGV